MKTVYTNCRICLANCGLEVTVGTDNRVQRIAPDSSQKVQVEPAVPLRRSG
jgi:hypothetical protein